MKNEIYDRLKQAVDQEQLVALATVVAGPGLGGQRLVWPDGSSCGDVGPRELEKQVEDLIARLFQSFACERATFPVTGEDVEVFVEIHPPRPKLIVVGAVHVAIPLVGFAKALGLRTIVVDPRTAFATAERFPHVDELDTRWPDEALEAIGVNENTFIALLSHDLKLDLPALEVVLRRPVRYVGALGSKKTHGKRVAALRERGISDDAIARIHNPIGLDLGGRRAEEIAVAIIAEMVAVSHGRS
jgi:xanthine dehydrogenase accessory factor